MQITVEPYDIDLIRTLKDIEHLLNTNKIQTKQESFGQKLVDALYLYCRKNKINLKENYGASIPIIIKQDDPDYIRLLAITLIAYPIPRITSFLSYQESFYNGKGYFPSIIEGYVYNYIQESSPFDNTERLDRIMKWVETKREFVGNSKPSIVLIQRNTMNKQELKDISKRLYKKGCTKNEFAFFHAIENGIPTVWKMSPEILSRLMFVLFSKKKALKVKGNKGYFMATGKLFDYGQESNPKIRLPEISHRINKNILENPTKSNKVDNFIKSIL